MITTGGFQVGALPTAPAIPSNVGQFDPQQAIRTADLQQQLFTKLANMAAQQKATQAKLAEEAATSNANASVVQSEADARKAGALRSTALQAPAIVDQEVALKGTTLGGQNTAAANTAGEETAKAAMTPGQRMILAAAGPATATEGTVTRTPEGSTISKSTKTASVAGETQPIATATQTTPPPLITPIPGLNGLPGANVVTTNDAKGGGAVHIVQPPLAAMTRINANTQWVNLGQIRDPETGNVVDQWQAQTTSMAGGAPKPVGPIVKTTAGSGPPNTAGTGAAAQPFISKMANKAIEDTTAEISTLQQRKLELENIQHAAENFIGTSAGAGRFTGPLRSGIGDAAAQEFVGSVQNALQTALQPLRGTGRVSNTEFNQALSALPKITDQAETIRSKLAYLNFVTDWALSRQQAYLDNLGQGQNTYQAFKKAQDQTPLPDVPNFPGGETVAHPAAAASPVHSFASEAEASKAAAAGQIKAGDKITINGQAGTWH